MKNNKILSNSAFRWELPETSREKGNECLYCSFQDEMKWEKGECVGFSGFVYLKLRLVLKWMGLALSCFNLTELLDLKTLRSLSIWKAGIVGKNSWLNWRAKSSILQELWIQSWSYLLREGFSELSNRRRVYVAVDILIADGLKFLLLRTQTLQILALWRLFSKEFIL